MLYAKKEPVGLFLTALFGLDMFSSSSETFVEVLSKQ